MNHTQAAARLQQIKDALASDKYDFVPCSPEIDALCREAAAVEAVLLAPPMTRDLSGEDLEWYRVTLEAEGALLADYDADPRDLVTYSDTLHPLFGYLGRREQKERDDYEFDRGFNEAKESRWDA
jgi:hypothetical protein